MKYIFDFDDVIFDAHAFKNKIADSLLRYGISREDFLDDYAQVRGPRYSVSKHIADIFQKHNLNIGTNEIEFIVDSLFVDIKELLNEDVVIFVSQHARDVFILSAGWPATGLEDSPRDWSIPSAPRSMPAAPDLPATARAAAL